MSRLLSVVMSVIMIFTVPFVVGNNQVYAANKKNSKAIVAYKNWLSQSNCVGFSVFDIDGDGIKELLTTYDGYGKNVYNFYVYTYNKKKVVSCTDNVAEYSMFGLYHNKSTKKLHGSHGGGGSEEHWYYKMGKGKVLKKVSLVKVENGYNYKTEKMTYKYYFNNKEITQKQYNNKNSNWNKNLQAFKFYKLTKANIKKYIK